MNELFICPHLVFCSESKMTKCAVKREVKCVMAGAKDSWLNAVRGRSTGVRKHKSVLSPVYVHDLSEGLWTFAALSGRWPNLKGWVLIKSRWRIFVRPWRDECTAANGQNLPGDKCVTPLMDDVHTRLLLKYTVHISTWHSRTLNCYWCLFFSCAFKLARSHKFAHELYVRSITFESFGGCVYMNKYSYRYLSGNIKNPQLGLSATV